MVFQVHNDSFLYIDLLATKKLKSTAWFEVNLTFSSRKIAFLILNGPIAPPPTSALRVKLKVYSVQLGMTLD